MIFVKDNPHIEIIKLSVLCVKFEVEFIEKKINFDRTLIFRKAQKFITFKNKSAMQVLWRFIDFENLKALGFDLSAVQGSIPPLSEIKICIEFTGFKAQIVNTSLIYEVSTNSVSVIENRTSLLLTQ